jgi:hypothetical protein
MSVFIWWYVAAGALLEFDFASFAHENRRSTRAALCRRIATGIQYHSSGQSNGDFQASK